MLNTSRVYRTFISRPFYYIGICITSHAPFMTKNRTFKNVNKFITSILI